MAHALVRRRVLVLGGTTESASLGRLLAVCPEIRATLSFAGRTLARAEQAIPSRVGGFGGVAGLCRWLTDHAIDCVIDATHPFAAQMAQHAALACRNLGIRRAKLVRAEWLKSDGDRWIPVTDPEAAVQALGPNPRRVFLPVGRGSLAPFAAAPFHHYVIRSIEPPADTAGLLEAQVILARPPFSVEDERGLLKHHAIDVIVTKNSGGTAAAAKLMAARQLNIPVIMIERPLPPLGPIVRDVREALAFILSD